MIGSRYESVESFELFGLLLEGEVGEEKRKTLLMQLQKPD